MSMLDNRVCSLVIAFQINLVERSKTQSALGKEWNTNFKHSFPVDK